MSTPSCSDRTTLPTARPTWTARPGSRTSRRSHETPPSARTCEEDGFQVGHLALFFPSGHANGGAPEPLTNRSTIVQGITGLFRDPAGAERSLERYEQDLRSRQLPDARDIPADGLGETSFGLRGKTSDGARVQIYVWRIGNLILAVSGSGPLAPGEVRSLADLVEGRT